MVRIAVVEDDPYDLNVICKYIQSYIDITSEPIDIRTFTNAEEFIKERTLIPQIDLLFLDIELPGKNGMELAVKLRRSGVNSLIVFATNMIQYAVQGYDVAAVDFIVKPLTEEMFLTKFRRYIDKIKSRKKALILKNREGMKKYLLSDIIYVEVQAHRLKVVTRKSEEEYSGTLKQIEEEISGGGFARCNKCYLVNLRYVESIHNDEVDVAGHRLQISRREKKAFMEAFARYEEV